MNDYKRAIIQFLCLVAILVAAWPRAARAEVFYTYYHVYYWAGEDGHGSGNGGNWNNWTPGNIRTTSNGANPPLVEVLPPESGDSLYVRGLQNFNFPVNMTLPILNTPGENSLYVAIDGNLNGGSLTLSSASFASGGNFQTSVLTVSGTAVLAELISAQAVQGGINLNGVTFAGKLISLSGNNILPEGDPATMNIANSLINAVQGDGTGTLYIGGSSGEWILNVTGSVLQGDKIRIGPDAGETILTLRGDTASFIGGTTVTIAPDAESIVRLKIHETTPQFAPSTNVLIGEKGKAYLTIDGQGEFNIGNTNVALEANSFAEIKLDHGQWTTMDLSFGGLGSANVVADNHSTMTSQRAVIGDKVTSETSTVTLDHESTWNVSAGLNVGRLGNSRLNLKHGSKVDVMQEIVVGVEENSSGIVEMTGAEKLATHTTFEVGRRGTGTLNIKEGGTVESDSYFFLGSYKKGVGEVVVDGAGSELHTKNKLFVGYGVTGVAGGGTGNGMGTVTVRNGGLITADKDVVLGENGSSHGILNITGATAKLELGPSARLTIGNMGRGELLLSEGATFTSNADVVLGKVANSAGLVTVDGPNSKWDVGGHLKIGERGFGQVQISGQGKVSATGDTLILGAESGSEGILELIGDGTELDFGGELTIGDKGEGKLVLHGGADYTTEDLTLGYSADSLGTLQVKGASGSLTTFVTTGDLTSGKSGAGLVSIESGGILTVQGDMIQGEQAASGNEEGYFNLTTVSGANSRLAITGNLTIGNLGTAALEMAGGILAVHGADVTLGKLNGSHGTLTIVAAEDAVDSEIQIHGALHVGAAGEGTVNIYGAKNNLVRADSISIGLEESAVGVVDLSGANTTFRAFNVEVGGAGKGTLRVQNGAAFRSSNLIIDAVDENKAEVFVTGAGEVDTEAGVAAGQMVVGQTGYGKLTASEGGTVGGSDQPTSLYVAAEGGSHGKATFDEAYGYLVDLDVGGGGSADLDVLNSSWIETSGKVHFGGGTRTVVTLNHSTLFTKEIIAQRNSTATISNTGNILMRTNGLVSLHGTNAEPATLNVESGGQVNTVDGMNNGTHFLAGSLGKAVVNVNSGGSIHVETVAVGAANGSNQSTMTVAGNTSLIDSVFIDVHPGATVTTSSGAVILAQRRATINGTVNVHGGSMRIGNLEATAGAPQGAVTVGPGGILKGKGTIKGNLFGKHAFEGPFDNMPKPKIGTGTSPGILTVEGDVSLDMGTVLELEVGGLMPGTQYDQLIATGSMNVQGFLELVVVNSGGGFQLPGIGDQFTFLSAAGGVSTAFENAASLKSVAGGWLVDWALSSNVTTTAVVVTALTPLVDGDYNGDGGVNAADYVVWRKMVGGINLAADGNRDGVIDNLDFAVWRANFGQSVGSGFGTVANTAIPEPSTLVMLVLAAAGVCSRRRRAA